MSIHVFYQLLTALVLIAMGFDIGRKINKLKKNYNALEAENAELKAKLG